MEDLMGKSSKYMVDFPTNFMEAIAAHPLQRDFPTHV